MIAVLPIIVVISAVWIGGDAAQVFRETGRRPWGMPWPVWVVATLLAWAIVVPLYVHHRRMCFGRYTRISVVGVLAMILAVCLSSLGALMLVVGEFGGATVFTLGIVLMMGGFLAGGSVPMRDAGQVRAEEDRRRELKAAHPSSPPWGFVAGAAVVCVALVVLAYAPGASKAGSQGGSPRPAIEPVNPADAERLDALLEENGELRERIVELEATLEGTERHQAVEAAASELAPPDRSTPKASQLRARISELEQDLRAAESRAALAQGEASKYYRGLERCVEQLNRRQSDLRVDPPAPRSPSVRPLLSPTVSPAGDHALVGGTLYNPGPSDQRVQVEIAILRDGRVVDRDLQSVLVPGSGELAVSSRLRGGSGSGTLSGRIRVVE